jgi:hypothetical protein
MNNRKTKSENYTNQILAISGVMIISGAILTTSIEIQKFNKFKHIISTCQEMFLGEILTVIFLIVPMISTRKKQVAYFKYFLAENPVLPDRKTSSILFIGFGGLLDALASCLEIVSFLIIPSTICALMKNGSIIFTALFSILINKKKLLKHNWVGILIIIIGFTVITLSNLFIKEPQIHQNQNESIYLGIILMLVSLIFSSLQIVYQEYLFLNYAVDPKRVVGSEGILGVFILTFVLIFTSIMPCQNDQICNIGSSFDSPGFAISRLVQEPNIMVAALVAILSSMIFNVSGATLTKLVSGIYRQMTQSLRSILVLVITWMLGMDEIEFWSFLLEMIGLILLLLGNLIYNKMIFIDSQRTDEKIVSDHEIDSYS